MKRRRNTAKTETERADLPYWRIGNGIVKAIQHPRNARSAENEAVIVHSVSEAAVMLYGLTTFDRCEKTGTAWQKALINEVSSYL